MVLLGSSATRLQAQSDSVRTEYKTEDQTITRTEIQRVIRYITRANIEEKTLVKFGVLPNSFTFTRNGSLNTLGISADLSVERKLSPSFSVLIGFDSQLLTNFWRSTAFSRISGGPSPYWLPDRTFSLVSSAKVAVRYYYGMARRIRDGKSANNFSGTYLAIQARRPVLNYLRTREHEFSTGEVRTDVRSSPLGTLNTPSVALQWGIQQRLWRWGYLDLSAGPELTFYDPYQGYNSNNGSRTSLALRINAIIGLSW